MGAFFSRNKMLSPDEASWEVSGRCWCSLESLAVCSVTFPGADTSTSLSRCLLGVTANVVPGSVVQEEEFYVCIYAAREGDYVLFYHEGGVDVGDVDAKAQKLLVAVDEKLNESDVKKHLLQHAPADKKE